MRTGCINANSMADIAATATSLTHISQEAMLEIIGMKPVRSESNAPAKEDTAKPEPHIKEEKTDSGELQKEQKPAAPKEEEPEPADGAAKPGKTDAVVRSGTPALAREDSNSADASGKTSKELKSILQLAKEAKLDTNIGHKRKSMDVGKTSEQQSERDSSEEGEQDAVKSDLENIKPEPKNKPIQIRIKLNQKYLTDYDCATCVAAKGRFRKTGEDGDKQTSALQRKDSFCWRCHKADINISCEVCPRSYHIKCVKQNVPADLDNWLCPECAITLKLENTSTRSSAMKDMTVEHLCSLLKFALKRMIKCTTVSNFMPGKTEPFTTPVNKRDFPDYSKYIVQPMDLTHLDKHIKENIYGSPQAFEADAKWILHNSIIFNGYQSKLTTAAKSIIKVCKQEMQEIENCSTCYLNANVKKNSWFVEVCPKPHILLWAKLKSFPYWPAKAMGTNSQGMVDARFFGAHDRAWVPIKDCYLFSRKDPNSSNVQKNNINECIKELEVHAAKLKEIYGEFNYAPYKTPYDPELEVEQLKIFLPKYKPNIQQQQQQPKTVVNKVKNIGTANGKSPSSDSTSSSSSSSNSSTSSSSSSASSSTNSSGAHKKRGRSRSRHRKSTYEEDRDMEGYGTDDEFESSLNSEKRKQLLKTFQDDEKPVEERGGEKEKRRSSIALSKDAGESGTGSSAGQNENKTGVQNAAHVQNNEQKDTIEPPQKRYKRTSEKLNDSFTKNNDTSRQSNVSDKINKVNIDENMEITLGNASSSTATSSDSSNDTANCVVKTKNVIQVDVENKELTISPQNKTKISDKIIRILNNADEAASSSADQNKEMTQTDLLLKEYTAQKESSSDAQAKASSGGGGGAKNLLEDTQVDEANINSMILNKKSSELDGVTIIRKGKKRAVETNETSQNKTPKLADHQLHNITINEANHMESKDAESDLNETDPLALVEVKTEPCSDDDEVIVTSPAKKPNEPPRAVDNVKKVIDAVVAGAATVNTVAKINTPKQQPPPPILLPPPQNPVRKTYNKARKSFPLPKNFETSAAPVTTVTFSIQPQQIINQAPPLVRIGSEALTTPPLNLLTLKATSPQIELKESQNYIPLPQISSPAAVRPTTTDATQTNAAAAPSTITTSATPAQAAPSNGTATNACLSGIMDEFRALSSSLPEVASKAVSELICKPPPKLKPRPTSALREGFEECIPSSAGQVTSKLNSMAYRMSDYFRGLITETLQDMSTEFGDNAATVAVLKAEIEQLKHNHSLEILEIKKNVYSILKDIQKSIVEDQRKLVEDTRAACEAEAIKRVHETKTKTWCALCFKEAQFYCCWNTSYCDYTCQQKHWAKHATKCTQNAASPQMAPPTSVAKTQPQVVLRPAPPPKTTNAKPLLPKPTKLLFNARATSLSNQIAQIMKSTSASHIRLVESTPGNFEIMGDAPMKVGRKVLTSTATMGKFKTGNIITVSSPSTSGVLMTSSSASSTQNTQNSSGNSVTANTAVAFDLPTISNVMSLADQSI